MEPTSTRLNKYLSEAGYCSRRAADKLIDEGRVTINGVVPEMGTKVLEGDEVKVLLTGVDNRGKFKLSMKAVDQETGEVFEDDSDDAKEANG